ncbi:MAG TPA: DUF502 domain-containing protein [Desulfonatronum sp.]|nr:DUF502 domain-containing protein [Desulfonatronum sp.]
MSEELHHKGILSRIKRFIRANLLAGILFLTPVMATFFFLRLFFNWVDGLLNFLPNRFRPENFLPFPIPGLGLILLFGTLLLTGFVVRNYLGRKLVKIWDRIIETIPLVNKLYLAVKQLVETIFNRSPQDFKRVVLVEFPKEGSYVLGFVTGVAVGETQRKTHRNVINVFVPTTPNPTSGFFLMIPEESVIPMDMSVEDAFKLLVSGGIISPDRKKENQGGTT